MKAIIVADKYEINKFKYPLIEKKKINQFTFFIYKIGQNNIIVVHSRIGIANAAACTQALIDNFPISQIFNYGAVGARPNSQLKILDLVYPKKIFYHDVITPWYDRGQTPSEKKYYENKIKSKFNNNLASGSSFVNDLDYVNQVFKEQNVDIFDMETAAIAQICDQNKIDLYVIKCVSDIIGSKTNIETINKNIKKSGTKAFDVTIKIVLEQ